MTIHEARKELQLRFGRIYAENEALIIAEMLIENVTTFAKADQAKHKEMDLSPEQVIQLDQYSDRILHHEPVQYVLNESWFHGLKFYVDKNVLIPRPETAELVDWIIRVVTKWPEKEDRNYKLIDIGTGSGIIPVSLRKNLPNYIETWACDIDDLVLTVARKNADLHEALVDFIAMDFLNEKERNQLPYVDVIISNPPYVPLNDKHEMDAHVVNYEPARALFIPDEDPMLFYKAIADYGKNKLQENGLIFVEIHEKRAIEVKDVFKAAGFKTIEIKKDMQGKDRMIQVSK